MAKLEDKLERLKQMEQMLIAHPEGLIQAEIGRRLGVDRSTVGRYLDGLTRLNVPVYEDDKLIKINTNHYLNNISLTIHETLALYLSSALIADRSDRYNPHTASALRKMGNALQHYSSEISREILENADKMDYKKKDHHFLENLTTINRSWCEGTLVKIEHYSKSRQQMIEYTMGIIKIIPYAAGFSLQLIGYSLIEDQLRTLRLDRIESAVLTDEKFNLELKEKVRQKLEHAWGIWYTDDPPVTVRLKFARRVAYRVKETVWHKSQVITENTDGTLEWSGEIAEPKEMYPWIRGWGSDVEILAPLNLREQFREELREMNKLYVL